MTASVIILDNMVVEVVKNMADNIAERPLAVPKGLSRRRVVLGGIGATVAGIAAVVGAGTIREASQRLARTPEQAAAAEQFNKTPLEKRISNLVVGKDGSNLRNRPSARESKQGENLIGRYEPGHIIPEAIIVEGEDPDVPGSLKKVEWYFIPQQSSKNGEVISGAFSYAGNFPSLHSPQPSK